VLYDAGGFHPDLVPQKLNRWQGDGETGLTQKVKAFGKASYIQDAWLLHLCGPDRLNVEYFKRRAYYQGVCDSFTSIRAGNAPNPKCLPGLPLSLYRKLKKFAGKILRRVPGSSSLWAEDAKEVRKLTGQSYLEGYRFHQSEVVEDLALLEWVKLPNYFDTDISNIHR
jgi:hypothetical protein